MKYDYDLAVIGGGSAGLSAALLSARLGARTALVEKNRMGGDCTWTGCVPSKTLLKTAGVAHAMQNAESYGLRPARPRVNFQSVMSHVNGVIEGIYENETPEALVKKGIDVFAGQASFIDPHEISAGKKTITARKFLITTGARPDIPKITGIKDVGYITYKNVWELKSLPGHMIVVGGGPLGCELAQAFSRLGTKITMVVSRERLLPRDEEAASSALSGVFESEGIEIVFNTRAERVLKKGQKIRLEAGSMELVGDVLLVATGRQPYTDGLELDNAGVDHDAKGVRVNRRLCTSQKHIFAAGDCTGDYQFTHYAGWQAYIAVRNALLPGSSKGIIKNVPWTTFTDPEVAHAGLTERQARDKFGNRVRTFECPMKHVDRARIEGDTTGLMKIVYKKNGKLLGVTVVARHAGEMIHEWVLALDRGLKVGNISRAIHVYPTYSIANMELASELRLRKVTAGSLGIILRKLVKKP